MMLDGLVQLPTSSEVVTDADEEVFLLYTMLQQGSSDAGTSQGCRGLGYVDSHKDTLHIEFELKSTTSRSDATVKKSKGFQERNQPTMRDRTVEIELAQDKTALRSRKGDTGSVLWMASVEFARLVLQQHHSCLENSLLPRGVLANSHVLELGAGVGLLSIAMSPLVRSYTVTDIAVLLPLIRKSISLNFPEWRHPGKPGSNISVQELDWLALHATTPTFRPRLLAADVDPVDLILLVDCIYHPSLLPALVTTIDFLAVPGRTTVLVVVELRSEEVIREFLDLWIKVSGWEVWRAGGLMDITYAIWVGWKK